MKVVEVPDDAAEILRLLEQAQEEDLLLRTTDGSEYTLVATDDFDEEIKRTRANKELMAFLEERAKQPATVSLDEIKRELDLE
jgi:hypothetical protein